MRRDCRSSEIGWKIPFQVGLTLTVVERLGPDRVASWSDVAESFRVGKMVDDSFKLYEELLSVKENS
jgi:hypothetical protein